MVQAFCQAPESLQSRLRAGLCRPAGEGSAHLGLPGAPRWGRGLPRGSAPAAPAHPHLQPSPLPCAGCHASHTLCQDNTTSRAGNRLLFLFFFFFFPSLHWVLLVQWIECAYRGGRGWLGWGERSHWLGDKQTGARKAGLLVLLALFHHQAVLLSLKVCVTIEAVKQSAPLL